MGKVMCGLYHVHVETSVHNKNGKCRCIGCFGTGCHNCSRYKELVNENFDELLAAYRENRAERQARCILCQSNHCK